MRVYVLLLGKSRGTGSFAFLVCISSQWPSDQSNGAGAFWGWDTLAALQHCAQRGKTDTKGRTSQESVYMRWPEQPESVAAEAAASRGWGRGGARSKEG